MVILALLTLRLIALRLVKVLELVRRFRKTDTKTPLILMGYTNPIHKYGTARFVKDAAEAGVDGLITVDLPPEEDSELAGLGDAEREARLVAWRLKQLVAAKHEIFDDKAKATRAVEWRASHEPQLSDLRESGSIEQDADVVMALYRNQEENSPKTEVIILKQKDGGLETINMSFKPECYTFTES